MDTPSKKSRRTWTRREETQLLQYYLNARNDASLKTDKGIKSKAWTLIVSRLAKDGIAATKDQCRSKYSRLMAEYDVYKRLCDLSGAGWCSETNCPTLHEEGWATLTEAQPRNAALFKRFRSEGFAHDTLCAQLAGDARATAEDADTVQLFDASALLEATKTVEDSDDEPAEGTVTRDHPPAPRDDAGAAQVSPALFSPSSSQRTDRVKRYRDGRRKSKAASSKSAGDEAKASIVSFMKTAEAYFLLKMKAMTRDRGDGSDDGETSSNKTYQDV